MTPSMSKMNDALSDLRVALAAGQERGTAIAEIAEEYGLKPALLAHFAETMAAKPLPTAKEADLERDKRDVQDLKRLFMED
ncbi:hypothetical protein MesoLj131a_48550 [Mesorhizobium sp. 131-2-1]|nr:hypothetical protein MesoLj131a_48550 [Mesorhizobium sp. 131-2-1]